MSSLPLDHWMPSLWESNCDHISWLILGKWSLMWTDWTNIRPMRIWDNSFIEYILRNIREYLLKRQLQIVGLFNCWSTAHVFSINCIDNINMCAWPFFLIKVQWNLYCKTTLWDRKLWSYMAGGLSSQVSINWILKAMFLEKWSYMTVWSLIAVVLQDRFHCNRM